MSSCYRVKRNGVVRTTPKVRFGRLLEIISPTYSLHPTLSVHNSLLAREERVALVANLDSNLCLGGSRGEGVPANASNLRLWIPLWMYFYLHDRS